MKRTTINYRINGFVKFYCLLLTMLFVLSSCKKTDTDADNPPAPPDETPVPASNPVTTSVIAYFDENLLTNEPVNVYVNQNLAAFANYTYNSAPFTGDAYSNVLKTEHAGLSTNFFAMERMVPLTASKRNYLEVCSKVSKTSLSILYTAAGVANLPGGGRLTYGANNFSYNGGALNGFAAVGYADPNANGFSLKLPSLYTDIDNKRWFLKNYGTYYIELPKPIDASADLRLFTKIPANLAATAPDSIETWVYSNKLWMRKGYAKKTGTEYEKKIDGSGVWAFATPVKGVYTTLKVRSSTGQPVINSIVQVKNSLQQEVAGVRTDMDGNAVCFVPSGEALTAHVLRYRYDPTLPIYSQSLSPLVAAAERTITIPVTNVQLITVKGTAKECNGTSIQNGSLLVKERNGAVRAHLPISNGTYAGSFVSAGSGELLLLKILNDATGQSGSDTAASLQTGTELTIAVNTCAPATNLFASYSIIDGGSTTTITGNAAALPSAVSLDAYQSSYQTTFSVQSGTSGFEFTSNIFTTGTYTGSGISGLWVNNAYYYYLPGKPMRITITRYDLLPGGYIEGSADFYYNEGTTLRHFTGNFRLRRLT